MAKNIRIFQIAKDLNISHTEILTFLKKKGVEVASHMTPVDEDIQEMIQGEFRKERQDIDRFRKEQVRREIHQTRIDEQQKAQKKLNLLSLDEQRSIEKKEKQTEEKKKKEKAVDKELKESKESKKEPKEEKKQVKKTKAKQHKLRKIDLSEIKSQIGNVNRKPSPKSDEDEPANRSAKDAVKQTLARMDKKSKKKVYKKDRKPEQDDLPDEEDIVKLKIISHVNGTIHATIDEHDLGVLFTKCRKCFGRVVKIRDAVKCSECGWIDDRKLSSDFEKADFLNFDEYK